MRAEHPWCEQGDLEVNPFDHPARQASLPDQLVEIQLGFRGLGSGLEFQHGAIVAQRSRSVEFDACSSKSVPGHVIEVELGLRDFACGLELQHCAILA